MLNDPMLDVIMLSVIMLTIVAPNWTSMGVLHNLSCFNQFASLNFLIWTVRQCKVRLG
jgi:hypothetical protein